VPTPRISGRACTMMLLRAACGADDSSLLGVVHLPPAMARGRQLLFGNEGAKSKKGRKPSSGHRQLRADYDPNKETKGPSPSSMFIPAHQVCWG